MPVQVLPMPMFMVRPQGLQGGGGGQFQGQQQAGMGGMGGMGGMNHNGGIPVGALGAPGGGFELNAGAASFDFSGQKKEYRMQGYVKTYNQAQGFGFITCTSEKFEPDIFFNRAIFGAPQVTKAGMKVSFTLDFNERQQPQAHNLRLTEVEKGLKPPGLDELETDKVYTGHIRTFNQNLGYGFIAGTDLQKTFDRDVFVHKHQMTPSL